MLDFSPVSLKFETGGYSVRKNSSCRRGKNLLFTKMGGWTGNRLLVIGLGMLTLV